MIRSIGQINLVIGKSRTKLQYTVGIGDTKVRNSDQLVTRTIGP